MGCGFAPEGKSVVQWNSVKTCGFGGNSFGHKHVFRTVLPTQDCLDCSAVKMCTLYLV